MVQIAVGNYIESKRPPERVRDLIGLGHGGHRHLIKMLRGQRAEYTDQTAEQTVGLRLEHRQQGSGWSTEAERADADQRSHEQSRAASQGVSRLSV